MGAQGTVGPDGNSVLPGGLYDMAELGDALADPELEARVAETLKSVDGDFDALKAKYKLEIAFSGNRSMLQPFAGLVSAWSNGGFLHGGGDEAIYFCPAKTEVRGMTQTCGAPITLQFVSGRVAICERCKKAHDPKKLVGQFFARLPMSTWATLITRLFRDLGCNTDIRIGIMRGDLRTATEAGTNRTILGDQLELVRDRREWVAYPLNRIIKDTSAGADLQGRIRAFLSA